MIKNNIAFALRCVGGVVVIGGVSWSLYALLGGGTWFQPFLFFVVSVVLGSIVWGISEIINLHAQRAWRKSCASWSPKHPLRRSRWSFAPTAAPSCLPAARPAPAAMK